MMQQYNSMSQVIITKETMMDRDYDHDYDPMQDRFDNNDYNKWDNIPKQI